MKKNARFLPPGQDPLLSMLPCSSRRISEGPKLQTPSRVLISDPADNEIAEDVRRKKAPNWCAEESSTLVHALIEERDKLRGKHAGSGGSEQDRQDAWVRVYDRVNAISRYGRSLEACQSKSSHFVSETRLKYLRLKKQVCATGGGSIDPVDLLKPHEQLALEYGGLTMTQGLLGVPDLFKSTEWATSTTDRPPSKKRRQTTSTITRSQAEEQAASEKQDGSESDCNEEVKAGDEESPEDDTSQVDLSSFTDSYSYCDGDNDQDCDWEMPTGALKSEYESSEYDTPRQSVKKSTLKFSSAAKERCAVLKNLMPKKKGTDSKNSQIEAQLKVTDEARASALFRLTQERMEKKKKKLSKKASGTEPAEPQIPTKRFRLEENAAGTRDEVLNVPGQAHQGEKSTSCSCSETFKDLMQRIICVEEKLEANEKVKGAAVTQISRAVALLSCVLINGKSRSSSDATQVEDSVKLATCAGQPPPIQGPETSLEVVDTGSDQIITVLVPDETHSPMDLSTPTHRQNSSRSNTIEANCSDVTQTSSTKETNSPKSDTRNDDDGGAIVGSMVIDKKRKRKDKPFKPPATRNKDMINN